MANHAASGVYSSTIDKSYYTVDSGIRSIMALFPIFSPRGPDNIIVTLYGEPQTTLERYYGMPNFSKYGQAYHNCMQWAETRYDTAVCRLLPTDAKFANIALVYSKTKTEVTQVKDQYTHSTGGQKTLKFKANDKIKKGMIVTIGDENFTIESIAPEFGEGPAAECTVTFLEDLTKTINANTQVFFKEAKIISKPIDALTDVKKIEQELEKKVTITDDVLELPFAIFAPVGRGVDYNKLSIRISKLDDEETYKDFSVYRLNIFDRDLTTGTDFNLGGEEFLFTFDPDSKDVNDMSFYITDVINVDSKFIKAYINQKSVKQIICDMYGLTYGEATERDIYTKDILKGDVGFNDNNKNRFGFGSDGSLWDADGNLNWGSEEAWQTDAQTNATNLIKAFYTGLIDTKILDRLWIPCKYIFDANFPLPAKTAMSRFTAGARNDVMAILDCGLKTTCEADINFRKTKLMIDSFASAIYPNNGITVDKYSGKEIRVTSTYNIIKLFAKVKNEYGFHYAVGGFNEKGLLSEMSKMSYSPLQEQRDNSIKVQLNTIVTRPDGIYCIENCTSKKGNSDLQQLHIADAYQDIRSSLEDFSEKYILNLRITNESLKQVQSEYTVFLQKYIDNKCCEYVTVSVESTPRERQQQKIRVNVGLKFASLARQVFLNMTILGEGGAQNS